MELIKNYTSSESDSSGKLPFKPNPKKPLEGEKRRIVTLQIENLCNKISHERRKDVSFAQNMRWVRNTVKNKKILSNFLIKKVILGKLVHSQNFFYLPCCNIFSTVKPTGQGHHGVRENPLLFLLEEEEKTELLIF